MSAELRPLLALAQRTISGIAILLAAGSLEAAEIQPIDSTFLPGALRNAQFGLPLVVGDLTGDQELDAVVLDAGVPTLLIRPEVFGTAIPAPITANDLAWLPPQGSESVGSVIAVGAAGVSRLRFDSATGAFTATAVGLSGWNDAKKIQVGQLDGIGGLDLAGLASDGKVLTALDVNGTWVVGTAFYASGTGAYGLYALDVQGDGDKELAVLTSIGVDLREPNGTSISSLSWSSAPIIAAVIATPSAAGSGRESLAVVSNLANGNQFIRVLMYTGNTPLTNLGAMGIVAFTSGDRDQDGDSDLVFSVRSATGFITLANTAALYGNPAFGAAAKTVLFGNQNRNPALNNAGIGLGDFDHDGDLDTLALAQGNAPNGSIYSDFGLVRNGSIDAEALKPTIPKVVYKSYAPPYPISPGGPPPEKIVVHLTAPTTLLAVTGATTKYEISAWHTEPTLFGTTCATDPTWLCPTTPVEITSPDTTFTLDAPPDFLGSGEAVSFVVRQIAVDSTGAVIRRGPAQTIVDCALPGSTAVSHLPGTVDSKNVSLVVNDDDGHETPDGTSGSVAVGPRVPDFDPNDRPLGT